MSNITDYDFRPVILRLSEPIVSLIRVLEYEKLKVKKSKRYFKYIKIFICSKNIL